MAAVTALLRKFLRLHLLLDVNDPRSDSCVVVGDVFGEILLGRRISYERSDHRLERVTEVNEERH